MRRKDWLAAIVSIPSILLELLVDPIKRFCWEEREILNGGEYDTEDDDTEQKVEKTDS